MSQNSKKYHAENGYICDIPKENLSKRNFKESIVPYLLRNYTVNSSNQVCPIYVIYIPIKKGTYVFNRNNKLVQPKSYYPLFDRFP